LFLFIKNDCGTGPFDPFHKSRTKAGSEFANIKKAIKKLEVINGVGFEELGELFFKGCNRISG
jgi:hypothetical protein